MFEQTRETNDFRTQWIFELSFPSLVCLHKICFPECWLRFFGERRKNRNLGQRPCAFLGKPQKKDFVLLNYFVFKVFSCFFGFSVLFLFLQLMLIGHPGTKINEKKLRKAKKKIQQTIEQFIKPHAAKTASLMQLVYHLTYSSYTFILHFAFIFSFLWNYWWNFFHQLVHFFFRSVYFHN